MAKVAIKVKMGAWCSKYTGTGKKRRCAPGHALKTRKNVKTVTFHKTGTVKSLCEPTRITIKGRSFIGRKGGKALCAGKNAPKGGASKVRSAFKTCAKKGTVTKSCMAKHGA